VTRGYSPRGELATIGYDGDTVDTRTFDDGGRMTSSAYNSGVSEARAYNTDNTLASIAFAGAPIGDLSYTWDANKNKTSESITGVMSGYGFSIPTNGYDSEDRLVGYNRNDNNMSQTWNLSLVGDWNSVTTNGTAQSRTHGPTHELLSAAGENVTHDVKGNMTLIPASLRPNATALKLNWDFDNRMSTADVGNDNSIDVTYKWDALGRRVYRDDSTTTEIYFQAGQQTIADYVVGAAAASPKYNYVYASYIDEPVLREEPSTSTKLYFHRNQQYSVVAVTDGSGGIEERYAYSAYGTSKIADEIGTARTANAAGSRCLFTGREWDPTISLYHYRARIYDAVSGRFLARDPS
jgi:RHS repeat-associated protein